MHELAQSIMHHTLLEPIKTNITKRGENSRLYNAELHFFFYNTFNISVCPTNQITEPRGKNYCLTLSQIFHRADKSGGNRTLILLNLWKLRFCQQKEMQRDKNGEIAVCPPFTPVLHTDCIHFECQQFTFPYLAAFLCNHSLSVCTAAKGLSL